MRSSPWLKAGPTSRSTLTHHTRQEAPHRQTRTRQTMHQNQSGGKQKLFAVPCVRRQETISARCVKARKHGSSSCGSISSLTISLRPCISWVLIGQWLLSMQGSIVFEPCWSDGSIPKLACLFSDLHSLSLDTVVYIGGTIHAGMKAVMYWTFHNTCKDCDVVSGVIHLTCPSTTLVYDSDLPNDAVAFRPK